MPLFLDEPGFIEKSFSSISSLLPEDSFWFRNYFIEIKEFYIGSATRHTTNIKLVQISDLHLRSIGYGLKKVVKKLNELKPDLILLTGDMTWDGSRLPEFEAFLKLIDPAIQKIAILGNWEYDVTIDLNLLRKIYTDNNCILLVNETRQFVCKNKTVAITGIDDYHKGNPDFPSAIKDYKKSDYHVVLTHCPEHRDVISTQMKDDVPIDFILSGHTHGGQVNFFGFIPFLPVGSGKYVKGWYNTTLPVLYVSKGIGTSVFPVRFGCTAEIGIFNLRV